MFYSTVINILHVTQHTCNKQCAFKIQDKM